MTSMRLRRRLGPLILPISVLAAFYSLGILKITFEASAVLAAAGHAPKGMGFKRVMMQGKTPWQAARLAGSAAASLLSESVAKQKALLQARTDRKSTRL